MSLRFAGKRGLGARWGMGAGCSKANTAAPCSQWGRHPAPERRLKERRRCRELQLVAELSTCCRSRWRLLGPAAPRLTGGSCAACHGTCNEVLRRPVDAKAVACLGLEIIVGTEVHRSCWSHAKHVDPNATPEAANSFRAHDVYEDSVQAHAGGARGLQAGLDHLKRGQNRRRDNSGQRPRKELPRGVGALGRVCLAHDSRKLVPPAGGPAVPSDDKRGEGVCSCGSAQAMSGRRHVPQHRIPPGHIAAKTGQRGLAGEVGCGGAQPCCCEPGIAARLVKDEPLHSRGRTSSIAFAFAFTGSAPTPLAPHGRSQAASFPALGGRRGGAAQPNSSLACWGGVMTWNANGHCCGMPAWGMFSH